MSADAATEFDASTKELGDRIVGLTLLEARKVVDYLKQVLEAEVSLAIMVSDARAADWPLIYVNPAFERVTGYRAEEATAFRTNTGLKRGPITYDSLTTGAVVDTSAPWSRGSRDASPRRSRAPARRWRRESRPRPAPSSES